MGRVTIKASLIIHLSDSYSGKGVIGAVRITDRYGRCALKKEFDHFVFINLPVGENAISIESDFYIKRTVTVTVTDKPRKIELSLFPNKGYRFDEDTFFLSGRVYTDYAAAAVRSENVKLLESCKKGESSVRIFDSACFRSEKILIEHSEEYNVYSVSKGTQQLEFILAPPAKTDIAASDKLYTVYELDPSGSTEYFLPIHGAVEELVLIGGGRIEKLWVDSNHLKYDFVKGK